MCVCKESISVFEAKWRIQTILSVVDFIELTLAGTSGSFERLKHEPEIGSQVYCCIKNLFRLKLCRKSDVYVVGTVGLDVEGFRLYGDISVLALKAYPNIKLLLWIGVGVHSCGVNPYELIVRHNSRGIAVIKQIALLDEAIGGVSVLKVVREDPCLMNCLLVP